MLHKQASTAKLKVCMQWQKGLQAAPVAATAAASSAAAEAGAYSRRTVDEFVF